MVIITERIRKKRQKRRKDRGLWLGLGLGALVSLIALLVMPIARKGLRAGGDWRARNDLLNRLSRNPRDWNANHALGLIFAADGESASALTCFENALRLAPTNLIFGNDYRKYCVLFKQHERAISFLDDLARKKPLLPEPRLQLALAYVDKAAATQNSPEAKERWLHESLKELTTIIQQDSNVPDVEQRKRNAEPVWMALYLRGLYYLHSSHRLSHLPRAIDSFQSCLKAQQEMFEQPQPFFVLSYIALGDAYVKENNLQKALQIWKEGLKQHRKDERLQQRISMSNQKLIAFVAKTRNSDNPIGTDLSVFWKDEK